MKAGICGGAVCNTRPWEARFAAAQRMWCGPGVSAFRAARCVPTINKFVLAVYRCFEAVGTLQRSTVGWHLWFYQFPRKQLAVDCAVRELSIASGADEDPSRHVDNSVGEHEQRTPPTEI
jgi:hypothetical protein